jgi:hypothetical protein
MDSHLASEALFSDGFVSGLLHRLCCHFRVLDWFPKIDKRA